MWWKSISSLSENVFVDFSELRDLFEVVGEILCPVKRFPWKRWWFPIILNIFEMRDYIARTWAVFRLTVTLLPFSSSLIQVLFYHDPVICAVNWWALVAGVAWRIVPRRDRSMYSKQIWTFPFLPSEIRSDFNSLTNDIARCYRLLQFHLM